MEATGKRVKRTRKSGHGGKPVGPAGIAVRSSSLAIEVGVIQKVVVDRAVEDHDPDMLVGLESVDDFLKLLRPFPGPSR